jgi:hypothetical protein
MSSLCLQSSRSVPAKSNGQPIVREKARRWPARNLQRHVRHAAPDEQQPSIEELAQELVAKDPETAARLEKVGEAARRVAELQVGAGTGHSTSRLNIRPILRLVPTQAGGT